MSDNRTLDVAVIGAGIAGLAAAISLRRAQHKVIIYERSSFKNEIGAAISLTPNANRVLSRWGFNYTDAGETDKYMFRRLNAETLEVLGRHDLSNVKKRFGYRFNAFHRVDLHDGMRKLAIGEDGDGEPVRIELGNEVVGVDCEIGLLVLKDGTEVVKDLIVIADGVNCRFLAQVCGHDVPRQKTGRSVYRTLVPVAKLMADPIVQPLFEKEPSGFCNTIAPKQGVFMVTYPCRNDEVMNVAVFHMTREHQRDAEDWNSDATIEDALYQLREGFHPGWAAIIKHADVVKCYTVSKREPIPRMTRGKAVLIGDAAHPMQPTHAQGGAMGIEDAAALGVLFSGIPVGDAIEPRLDLFNQLRLPRDNTTQLLSNAMFYNEPMEAQSARIREFYKGSLLPPKVEGWSPEISNFWFQYDVFHETEKALQFLGREGGIPDDTIQHFGFKAPDSTV